MNKFTFNKLSYGVYIVTTWADGRPTGCVANSAMQITSNPATIAISINHDNFTNACIKDTKVFAINILGENSDPSLIGEFGFKSGKDNNKFEKSEPIINNYLPTVKGAIAYITCKVIDVMETETHSVFLAQVDNAEIVNDTDQPMTYAYYHNVVKGKAPKNAPTFIG